MPGGSARLVSIAAMRRINFKVRTVTFDGGPGPGREILMRRHGNVFAESLLYIGIAAIGVHDAAAILREDT